MQEAHILDPFRSGRFCNINVAKYFSRDAVLRHLHVCGHPCFDISVPFPTDLTALVSFDIASRLQEATHCGELLPSTFAISLCFVLVSFTLEKVGPEKWVDESDQRSCNCVDVAKNTNAHKGSCLFNCRHFW